MIDAMMCIVGWGYAVGLLGVGRQQRAERTIRVAQLMMERRLRKEGSDWASALSYCQTLLCLPHWCRFVPIS